MSTEQAQEITEETPPQSTSPEADIPPKLKIEFVTDDATPEEKQFQDWINDSNRVGFDTRNRELIAFNPDTNSTNEPQQRVGMDRLNILMGKDLKGEPLIDLAVAGVNVEIFCPENEKEKWRLLLEKKKAEKKQIELELSNPKKKLVLTPKKVLDVIQKGLNEKPTDPNRVITIEKVIKTIQNDLARETDPSRVITPEILLQLLKPTEAEKAALIEKAKRATEVASDTTDAVLKGAIRLIEHMPSGRLGEIIRKVSPIPGYNLGDAITIVQALNNLNTLRHEGKTTENGLDPLTEITNILGAVIPSFNAENASAIIGLISAKKS